MKQMKYFFLICILSMLNLSMSLAQGLSLSFNLSETDTLANMIAESKKYDITSLTLSGFVNDVNVKYVQDLNQNGKLKILDLSGLNYISANGQSRIVQKTFKRNDSNRKKDRFEGLVEFLNEYGYPNAKSINQDVLGSGFYSLTVTVEDIINEQSVTRTFSGMNGSHITYGYFHYNRTIQNNFCTLMPKRIFDDCEFSVFYAPESIEIIGGKDCSFRLAKCSEYHLGEKTRVIGENAFKNSQIGKLILSSHVDSIYSNAFENTVGNVFASADNICAAKYIGNAAFKNYTFNGDRNFSIALSATHIDSVAFQNAVLPDVISLKNIEEICGNAFAGSSIKEIELGDKIDSIRNDVFVSCADLQEFKGGQNIIYIGKSAFANCKKLKSVAELSKLCKIDEKAFEHCELLENFTPSNMLTSIGDEAFAYNTALPKFTLPEAIKEVGRSAFAYSGVKELGLGKYGEYRGDLTVGCDSLEAITVTSDNEKLKSEEGVLFTKDGKRLLAYPRARKQPLYEIGNPVVEIADSAFYGARILNSLVIGESVNKIGRNAFANSNILELKVLPSASPALTETLGLNQQTVRLYVHENAYNTYYIAHYWGDFKNIYIIENAVSPNNIIHVETAGTIPRYIGFGNQYKYNALKLSGSLNSDDIRYLREMAGRAIDGNPTSGTLTDLDFSQASIVSGGSGYYQKSTSSSGMLTTKENIIGESMFEGCHLEKIAISDNATSISAKAFSECPLKEFLVPVGVTAIGSQAFAGATLSSFSVPAALVSISLDSFYGMESLKEVNVDPENSAYQSVDNVLFTKDGTSLLLYPYGKEGVSYIIPETVTNISSYAFGGRQLKAVRGNEGLKTIDPYAFDNLYSLESVNLPSTLTKIGPYAFNGCNNLMIVSCKAYTPPTLEIDRHSDYIVLYTSFSQRTYRDALLQVPEKNGGYKSSPGWKLFNDIFESDSWMTGIIPIKADGMDNSKGIRYYDLNGRPLAEPTKGMNIIKMSDGSTRKVVLK